LKAANYYYSGLQHTLPAVISGNRIFAAALMTRFRSTLQLVVLLTLFPLYSGASVFPAEGVYFSFSAFRAAIPDLVKKDLHRELDKDHFTIRQWAAAEKLYYTSETGRKLEVGLDSIWGFSENGVVFVLLGNRFHKISTLGAISYFLESYPTIGGNPSPVITDTRGSSAYRLLDMETGEFYYYTVEDFSLLLERDENLFREFQAIESPKEKKKKIFLFLERYNKAHPLQPEG
jgi:hypothetical protein